jgi:MFS family permease
MNQKMAGFGPSSYVKITLLGFAITALWSSLHSIILPLQLLDFVAESQKNTYLGLLTFAGLILAMAAQPIAGAISDRSGFRWGRRRPYILLGILAGVLFLAGIGLAGSFAILFITYCLLQISVNTAQGPYQAFIPEMVPYGKRGTASGVKSLLEILGGVALLYPIALFMDNFADGEGKVWLWLSLTLLGVLLLAFMAATVLLVKEPAARAGPRQSILATLVKPFKIDIRAHRDFIWFLASRLLIFMAFATIGRRLPCRAPLRPHRTTTHRPCFWAAGGGRRGHNLLLSELCRRADRGRDYRGGPGRLHQHQLGAGYRPGGQGGGSTLSGHSQYGHRRWCRFSPPDRAGD